MIGNQLYQLDRALWEIFRYGERAQQFEADPDAYLAEFDLSDEARRAMKERDLRAIFQLRAHPFLVYNFTMRLHGGFSMEMTHDYMRQVGDLQLLDIET